eukprot:c25420_g1_i1 orf=492-1202(-)
MGLVKLVLADAAITFLWSSYVAAMGPAGAFIVSSLNLQGYGLAVMVVLLAINVFLFGWLGACLGGAIWNPTPLVAFYSLGKSEDSLFTLAVRFPAQALGAVGAVLATRELVPASYKHVFGGPTMKVDLYTAILAEFVLTFAIIFAILFALLRGPKSSFAKNWIIILSTVAVVLLGAGYTGPSLNPANAFGWAYANEKHGTSEHFIVYWLAPIAGSLIASWFFQLLFGLDKPKEKAA